MVQAVLCDIDGTLMQYHSQGRCCDEPATQLQCDDRNDAHRKQKGVAEATPLLPK